MLFPPSRIVVNIFNVSNDNTCIEYFLITHKFENRDNIKQDYFPIYLLFLISIRLFFCFKHIQISLKQVNPVTKN